MEVDDEEELRRYVLRHCREFLTEAERRADRAGMVGIKAADAERRGSRALAGKLREKWCDDRDKEVRSLLADGYEMFRLRLVRRLLADPGVQALIVRCPSCGRLARTPLARQCLRCKHTWREGPSPEPA
ncbi:MAG: hypothetical protein U0800_27610 [Isosphaeraceae bacterium]